MTITHEPRPDDWNAIEFEVVTDRTMTQVVRDAMGNADDMDEAACPLCRVPYPVGDLPRHVGSDRCARICCEWRIREVLEESPALNVA